MLHNLIIFLIVATNLVSGLGQSPSFSFKISRSSLGFIIDETGQVIGTGFVFEKPNQVVTCAHVAKNKKIWFCPVSPSDVSYSLTLRMFNDSDDIAVFWSDDSISSQPLQRGDFKKVSPRDNIIYAGFNIDESNTMSSMVMKIHKAEVSATGLVHNSVKVISFLEFQGEGIPGYSGGPVLDTNGNVIAIFTQAWTMKGLKKNAQEVIVNRAFSLGTINN